jgi:hypothetical protein
MVDNLLEATRVEVAPKSFERYAEILQNFRTPALGNLQLTKLALAHIQDASNRWQAAVAATGRPAALHPGLAGTFIAFLPRHYPAWSMLPSFAIEELPRLNWSKPKACSCSGRQTATRDSRKA